MTSGGKYVAVQGAGEGAPFGADGLDRMLRLARRGIGKLLRLESQAIPKG